MKRILIFLAGTFLTCTSLLAGAAAACKTDTVDSDKWDALVESFDPLIEDQFEDSSDVSEDYPEPKISAETAKAMEEADPRSAVAYNAETGEITFVPYDPARENDIVELAPSGGI